MSQPEEDTAQDDKDNVLFKKLRKLINLIDQLRDVGVNEYIKLPRIASLGTQSSGKSSVLESIVGLDFLPRGDGVVTRRPLELRLCHINDGEPWAIFAEKKGQKFTDFNKVRETIEELTDAVCAKEKNIKDLPIVLNVYSQTCPDLTLIDLPGITRVPVGDQPPDIEKITKDMASRYCSDPLTIILCVIAANTDIATSDGLKMAKEIDSKGERTLGVLTKLDIMDQGTDARKALMNEEIELKLGYVGVKNRSKQDLIDRISMKEAFRKEQLFFKNHPVYKNMAPGYYGTNVLIQKLTKILFRIIRQHLPHIIKSISENIKKCEEELDSLGEPMPLDDSGKFNLLWKMLNEYCSMFKNVLKGKYNRKRTFLKDEGGYKIKDMFKNVLLEFTGDFKATKNYKDEDINYALLIHEGDSIPGFPSVDAFYYLLRPQLEKLQDPIYDCFNNVYTYLENLSNTILEKSFARFPQAINDIGELINQFLLEERERTKHLLDCVVEQEINYLYTNDNDYLYNYTSFMAKHIQQQGNLSTSNHIQQQGNLSTSNSRGNIKKEDQQQNQQPQKQGNLSGSNSRGNIKKEDQQQNQPPQNQGNLSGSNSRGNIKKENEDQEQQPQPQQPKPIKLTNAQTHEIFVNEIRQRIEAYFKLIVRNMRDSVPKIIGNNLVRSIEEKMQMTLYNKLNKTNDIINSLNEPESVMMRRIELTEKLKVMRDAQQIIRRDPDLMQVMQININDSDITGSGKAPAKKKEKLPEVKKKAANLFGNH